MVVEGRHPHRNRAVSTLHAQGIDIDHLLVLQEILFLEGWAGGHGGPVRRVRDGLDHLIDAGGSQNGAEGARRLLKKTSPTHVLTRSSRTLIFVAFCHECLPPLATTLFT